jgi:hypothetical protein
MPDRRENAWRAWRLTAVLLEQAHVKYIMELGAWG